MSLQLFSKKRVLDMWLGDFTRLPKVVLLYFTLLLVRDLIYIYDTHETNMRNFEI